MGDLLGSPRVAPLFFLCYFFFLIYFIFVATNANTYYILLRITLRVRSYQQQRTASHQNSAVKCDWAIVVVGWVTASEVLVVHPFFFFCYFFFLIYFIFVTTNAYLSRFLFYLILFSSPQTHIKFYSA